MNPFKSKDAHPTDQVADWEDEGGATARLEPPGATRRPPNPGSRLTGNANPEDAPPSSSR